MKNSMYTESIAPSLERIESELSQLISDNKKVFITSSFQTHSIPLLHFLAQNFKTIDVYFINTGFHFAETYQYVDDISQLLGISPIFLKSPVSKLLQKDSSNRFFYVEDTDYCCHINKTLPLDNVLKQYDVWISGLRKDQSKFRNQLPVFQDFKFNTIKYHPILDWNNKMIAAYRQKFYLPPHPLEAQGYLSIGCKPCTFKLLDENMDGRNGRWEGQTKNECGIHLSS